MSIAANNAEMRATGDGTTVNFTCDWRIMNQSEVAFYVDAVLQAYGSQYSISGIGNSSFVITAFTAPASGALVTALRNQPVSQVSNYIPNEVYNPVKVLNDLDRQTAVSQMLSERTRRSLKFRTDSVLTDVPVDDPTAMYLMRANSTGTRIEFVSPTGLGLAFAGSGQVIVTAFNVRDDPYNAYGDCTNGVNGHDDSAAFQACFDDARAAGGSVYIPGRVGAGYRIDSPQNLTNINGLRIYGDVANAPAFGLAVIPPTGGSMIYANTGGVLFDCLGANNIIFRDVFVNSLPCTTPSTVGFLFGTSTGVQNGTPGSANCSLENVAIYLKDANNSCPVYGVNHNLSHFINVWTLGVYGITQTTTDFLSITPPYGTYGAAVGSVGNTFNSCRLLGYGGAPVFYFEGGGAHDIQQCYLATINGGPAYAGQSYAMFLEDVVDMRIKVEEDYFPSLFQMAGICQRIDMSGTVYPNQTPLAVGVPIVGFFNGTSVDASNFALLVVSGALPNNNYHYTSVGGGAPTMDLWLNNTFHFNYNASPNCAFFNASNAVSVPFKNLAFLGTNDAPTNTFEINGVGAAASDERGSVNGVAFGSG